MTDGFSERDACFCQPDHLLDDADSAGKKIGVERAERSSYLFLSLLAGGAHLAFGSDWPVCISRNSFSDYSHFVSREKYTDSLFLCGDIGS